MIQSDAPGDAHVLDDSGRMSQAWLEYLQRTSATNGVGDYQQSWNDDLGPQFILCDGRLVSVSAYPSLYALIGLRYGGSPGQFAVPTIPSVFSGGSDPAGRPALYTFIRAA